MMKKRKTNKAKRSVKSCKNHGDCCFCKGNRTFQAKKENLKAGYDIIMHLLKGGRK